MGILVSLALLPFVQLGLNYYASVATLLAAMTIFLCAPTLATGARRYWMFVLPIIALMFLPLVGNAQIGLGEMLRTGREALIFAIIMFFRPERELSFSLRTQRALMRLCFLLASMMIALVVYQTISLARGAYVGIPISLFVRNVGTLPGQLDLIYSRIRPMGTFGEPSYLALIMFSLMIIVRGRIWTQRLALTTFCICFVAVLLSQSALGIVFAVLLALASLRERYGNLATIFTILSALVVMPLIGADIVDRLLNISDFGTESSGYARVYAPLVVIPSFLVENPLGLAYDSLQLTTFAYGLPVTWAEIVQNGLFNIILSYGLVGAIMIVCIFQKVRHSLTLLLFTAFVMMQNGDQFGFDKLALYLMVVSLVPKSGPNRKPAIAERDSMLSRGRSSAPAS